jgi:hypothetical protein
MAIRQSHPTQACWFGAIRSVMTEGGIAAGLNHAIKQSA